MTIALLLHLGDKDFAKIQQIVISTKVANFAKLITGQIVNLAIMTKKSQSNRQSYANSNKECFYCRKKRYFVKDYCLVPKKKLSKEEKTKKETNELNSKNIKKKKRLSQLGLDPSHKYITTITISFILLVKRL